MAEKNLKDIFQEEGMEGVDTQPTTDNQEQSDQNTDEGNTDQNTEDQTGQENKTEQEGTEQEGTGQEEAGQTGQTQTTDQKTDQQTQTEQTDQEPSSEQQILETINSSLQTQFESVNDIKDLISVKDQVETYKQQLKEKDEALKAAGDPYQSFASEKLLKANEIIKNNSDIPENVAFQLAVQDFDNISDDDVLILSKVKDNPNWQGQENMVKKMIDHSYGLNKYNDQDEDISQEQQEELDIAKMTKQSDAQKARKELKNMANVEVPQQTDVEQQYKQNKEQQEQEQKQKIEQVKPVANSMIERDLDKIQIGNKEKIEFEIDGSFKDFLRENDYLAQYLANNYDSNDSNSYQQAVDKVKQLYMVNNINKVVDDAVKSERTRMQDQFDKQNHNPKEKNYQERPQQTDTDRKNEETESEFVKQVGV